MGAVLPNGLTASLAVFIIVFASFKVVFGVLRIIYGIFTLPIGQ
jgi:hypothetical protein